MIEFILALGVVFGLGILVGKLDSRADDRRRRRHAHGRDWGQL